MDLLHAGPTLQGPSFRHIPSRHLVWTFVPIDRVSTEATAPQITHIPTNRTLKGRRTTRVTPTAGQNARATPPQSNRILAAAPVAPTTTAPRGPAPQVPVQAVTATRRPQAAPCPEAPDIATFRTASRPLFAITS